MERLGQTGDLLGVVSSHSYNAADAFGDTRLLCDHEVFDITGFGNVASGCSAEFLEIKPMRDVRSATEFDAGLPPLRILDILRNFIDVEFESDHTDGIGVRLSKDCAQTWNLIRSFKRELLAEDFDVALDPIDTQRLDFLEFGERNSSFVREVKAELGLRDKRAFLIDMVTQNLP